MAIYPDWVLKHKKKGTYINCVKDKYYLYAAHSERVPGTNKVRRVSDGYIGRITEKDGLILAREKVTGEVVVLKYGLHMTALVLSDTILKGLRREFRTSAESILIIGILLATEHCADEETFQASYLSVVYPKMFKRELNEKQQVGVERCSRMVRSKLDTVLGGDGRMLARLDRVYAVFANSKMYLSKKPAGLDEWLKEKNIDWSDLI